MAKVGAAYRHALQPRLLVLVAVAALAAAWNQLNPDQALDAAHQGSLLGGFLMYKVPLVLLVADDNLPKVRAAGEAPLLPARAREVEALSAAISAAVTPLLVRSRTAITR